MKKIYILILISLFSNASWAKDIDGEFAVFSMGGQTCKQYLKTSDVRNETFDFYMEWLQGYLSAFNLIMPNTYNILGERSFTQVLNWLEKYCFENPDERFVNAAANLSVRLYPSRQNLATNKNTKDKWSKTGPIVSNSKKQLKAIREAVPK